MICYRLAEIFVNYKSWVVTSSQFCILRITFGCILYDLRYQNIYFHFFDEGHLFHNNTHMSLYYIETITIMLNQSLVSDKISHETPIVTNHNMFVKLFEKQNNINTKEENNYNIMCISVFSTLMKILCLFTFLRKFPSLRCNK